MELLVRIIHAVDSFRNRLCVESTVQKINTSERLTTEIYIA